MNISYAAIMAVSILAALMLSARTQMPLPLTLKQRWGVRYAAFVGSMIGAKLPFVLMNPARLMEMSAWTENGKTIVFGLAFGYFGVEIAKYYLGRWSCFVGGCCFGSSTSLPWGVDFGDGVPRHPTQIYEFLFHLTAAVILTQLQRKEIFQGQLIKFYFIIYFIYRFFTEFLRPEPRVGLGLTFYQLSCLVLIPVFSALWWHDSKQFLASRKANLVFDE
jgi:phosphatidylglycerol---prolipoprotein diacylglyceryl transferase